METYNVTFENDNEGVFAISLGENPAIEVDFIALSAQEVIKLQEVDAEKRIIISPILIPDKPIFRVDDNGNEFNIVFSAETIQKAQQYFYKNGYQNNSNIEHDDKLKLSDVTFVESWIKEDETHDKSVKYGFDLPVGTWFATMKVWNDAVWDKIKAGEVKGVSIEGNFGLDKINLNYMNIKETLKEALVELGLAKKEAEVKLGAVAIVGGDVTVEYEGEELAVGTEVFVTDENGEKVAAPDGEHELETGVIITVASGVVTEVKEVEPAEEESVEAEAEVEMADDKYAALEGKVNGLVEAFENFKISMSAQITEGLSKIAESVEKEDEKVEEVKLTKAMPKVEMAAEPKNAKERILNKIKNLK